MSKEEQKKLRHLHVLRRMLTFRYNRINEANLELLQNEKREVVLETTMKEKGDNVFIYRDRLTELLIQDKVFKKQKKIWKDEIPAIEKEIKRIEKDLGVLIQK